MVVAAGDKSFPFSTPEQQANEPEYRKLFGHLGGGIIDDRLGSAFQAAVNNTSQQVTVAAGRGKSAAAVLDATQTAVLALLSEGVQPAVGQSRFDRIVLRTDYEANRCERALSPGRPATTGQQVAPALVRDEAGVFEEPLWLVQRTVRSTGVTIALEDERAWLGPTLYLAPDAPLPADAYIGTRVYRGEHFFQRKLDAQRRPVWVRAEPEQKHWGNLRRRVDTLPAGQRADLTYNEGFGTLAAVTVSGPPGRYVIRATACVRVDNAQGGPVLTQDVACQMRVGVGATNATGDGDMAVPVKPNAGRQTIPFEWDQTYLATGAFNLALFFRTTAGLGVAEIGSCVSADWVGPA